MTYLQIDHVTPYYIVKALLGQSLRAFPLVILLDLLLYCLLRRRPSLFRLVKGLLLLATAAVFVTDLFTLYYYRLSLNRAMLSILLTTNLREGREFLEMYLTDGRFWLFLLAVALSLALLRYAFALLMRWRRLLLICLLSLFCLSACSAVRYVLLNYAGRIWNSAAMLRLGPMLYDIHRESEMFKEIMAGAPKDVVLTRDESTIPYVIFVLGESTTRWHLALYGYPLPTSPRLTARKDRGGVHVFSDVVSPHPSTMAVMEKLFTFYRTGDEGDWFAHTDLFSILRRAGYRTTWLSNQESGLVGIVGDFYAGQCDTHRFTIPRDTWEDGITYDGALLPLLDEALSADGEKNFYVLHLTGSHGNYYRRYPKESFGRFSFRDEGGFEGITDAQKRIRAEYDNSILYNDFVVDEIIRRFEDKSAVVLYVPDHGEEVYDEFDFAGHGGHERHCFEIPMLIWTSEKFRQTYPDLERRIAGGVDQPFMTDDMIHLLLDLLSIETPEYDPSKSPINEAFDAARQRFCDGRLYDKEDGLK